MNVVGLVARASERIYTFTSIPSYRVFVVVIISKAGLVSERDFALTCVPSVCGECVSFESHIVNYLRFIQLTAIVKLKNYNAF